MSDKEIKTSGADEGWLDMGSAPKDATEIILRIPCKGWPGHYSMIGHWAQDLSGEEQPPFKGWFWRHADGFAQLPTPTGWRPLAKPASEPAGGGVREALQAYHDAYSDRRFAPEGSHEAYDAAARLEDAHDLATTALSSPASSSPAEAEALPDGVEAVRVLREAEAAFEAIRVILVNELDEPVRQAFWRAVAARDAVRRALSPAPAQAGSQKDMSAHPRGSGPGPSSVEGGA